MMVLVLALISLPIAEVALLVAVGQQIGVLSTIAILVAEAILGAWLVRREGSRAWTALNKTMRSGQLPSGELADAALILVGGTLLTVPGFVTDVFGLIFLLPFTRPFARRVLGWLVARQVQRRLGVDPAVLRARMQPDSTIEGEAVDLPTESQPGAREPGPHHQIDP